MSETGHNHIAGEWACKKPGTVVSSGQGISLADITQSLNISSSSALSNSCFINKITEDSREVTSGSLFIALSGSRQDGHDFIEQAIESGCAVLLVEKDRPLAEIVSDSPVCILQVTDTRKALGILAEMIFQFPAKNMTMVAVTGTNGKTTVTYLFESVLRHAGRNPGVLGTVNYRYQLPTGKMRKIPSPFTTPEPFLLQKILREMADSGVETVIMEVSSHGLEQNRIGNLLFDLAAFTNLSRDHLDYHSDMEDYFSAKALLFSAHLKDTGKAVVTYGDDDSSIWSERLHDICTDNGYPVLSCGRRKNCDVSAVNVSGTLRQTEITFQTPEGSCLVCSTLVGEFNVENLQTTFAMALASGVSSSTICKALSQAGGAPGRMQRIRICSSEHHFRPTVFVDFAHTPDALEQVLKTIKMLPHRNLFCVFGCGGDRDVGKRPLMGEIAGRYADVAILTDDNPRSEDSQAILSSVAEGIKKSGQIQQNNDWLQSRKSGNSGYLLIADRHRAIHTGIAAAGCDDIVLIAGKGHENYQISNSGRKFFDDSLEAAEALSNWTLESLTLATGGQLINNSAYNELSGSINTDSRTIQPNDIFLALKGEIFDAHDYVKQVIGAGAGCLILEREPEFPPSIPVILVKNTEQALGDLASYRRSCMKIFTTPVVAAITGSSGKTTVKEMCASIFSEQWPEVSDAAPERVLKTEGNFNNLIGLPLSLLPISPKHQAVILEMGMNRPGEIARLTEIADPDIACILNVHGAHLQGLGTIEGVAKAKGELFKGCGKETVLVVNNDDSRVTELAEPCEQEKIFFGLAGNGSAVPDVYATELETGHGEEITFLLHVKDQVAQVILQVPGSHNISNALAAAAIAHCAGIGITCIARGLSAFMPTDRRMQLLQGPAGSRIINDTYNANPESMKAGISTLCDLGEGVHIAVLGDMLELGPESSELHKEIGAHAADSGVDHLCLVGNFAASTASGAVGQGMDASSVRIFETKDDCFNWLNDLLAGEAIPSGTYILVKGSRGMHLEDLAQRLSEKN